MNKGKLLCLLLTSVCGMGLFPAVELLVGCC